MRPYLERGIGIRFAARKRPTSRNIASARAGSASAAGNARDRKGNPLTIKLKGPVEPYFRNEAVHKSGNCRKEGGRPEGGLFHSERHVLDQTPAFAVNKISGST